MIKRILSALFALALSATAALAQSNPGLSFGQVPTAGQWNSYFSGKADFPVAVSSISGILALANGGTAAALTPSNGGIVYSTGSQLAIFSGTSLAGQCLLSGSNTTPSWGSCAGGAIAGGPLNAVQSANPVGTLYGDGNFLYTLNGRTTQQSTSGNAPSAVTRVTTDATPRTVSGLDSNNTAYTAFGKGSANTYGVLFSESAGIGGETELGIAGQAQTPAAIGGTGRLFSGLHMYRLADSLPGGGTNYRRAGIGWFATDSLNITLESAGSLVGINGGINLTADATPAGGLSNTINFSTSFAPPGPGGSITAITNPGGVVTVTGNQFFNGETVLLGGTLPSGLSTLTTYFVCARSGSNFNVATSFANCQSATYVATSSNFVGPATATPGAQVTSVSVASPTVVTVDHHHLLPGTGIIFALNGGSLPTCSPALTPGTTYFTSGPLTGMTQGTFQLATASLGPTLINCTSGTFSGNVTYTVDSTQNSVPGGGGLTIATPDGGGGTNSGNEFIFTSIWNASPLGVTVGPVAGVSVVLLNAPASSPVFQYSIANLGQLPFTVDVAGRITNVLASICNSGCGALVPLVTGEVDMYTAQAAAGAGSTNYPVIAVQNKTSGNNKSGIRFINANGVNDWMISQFNNGDTATEDLLFTQQANGFIDFNATSGKITMENFLVFGWSATNPVNQASSPDTGTSRCGVACMAVGNGTAADASGTISAANWTSGGLAGVTCSGSPTASFASTKGIVTHC